MVVERGKTCSRFKRKNTISTEQLESEGFISIFTDKTWKVIKGSLVIAKGEKVGTLYLCTGNTDSSISLAYTRVDTTLWHHRLGHMSEKGMQILHKRNLLSNLKKIDLDFCEHCVEYIFMLPFYSINYTFASITIHFASISFHIFHKTAYARYIYHSLA